MHLDFLENSAGSGTAKGIHRRNMGDNAAGRPGLLIVAGLL
ncbi:MAG TPA: hypothetical protein VNM46_17375 [Xanthobacteraceae bacterium]|nr:hypothetical protein [Xanthobacteraceae bacterium]